MSTRPPPARKILAQALVAMQKNEHRLSPEAYRLVVGKLASAFKSAYPKFDIDSFLRDCGA